MSALKKIPRWTTGKAAEDWLHRADLSDYDLSKAVPMAEFLEHAELVRKDLGLTSNSRHASTPTPPRGPRR